MASVRDDPLLNFGLLNRTPNNVWGDIQSDEQIFADWEAANPWEMTVDDIINDPHGTWIQDIPPTGTEFQGLEGMGFPAVEGRALVNVGNYNLDFDRYFDVAAAQDFEGGRWEPMVEEYLPSYRDDALVNVDVADSVRELMSAFENETGDPFELESAFRSPFHNFAVGGSPTSGHMEGLSLDVTDKKSQEWLKKNGEKYGWVLADYTKKDGTKNKSHFDYDPAVKHAYDISPTLIDYDIDDSGYQHWDESPMDYPGRLLATQEGLGDIEHLATLNPQSTKGSRVFTESGNEGHLFYPQNATDKEKAAFDHMMRQYSSYGKADPRVSKFARQSGGYWPIPSYIAESGQLPMEEGIDYWEDFGGQLRTKLDQEKMGIERRALTGLDRDMSQSGDSRADLMDDIIESYRQKTPVNDPVAAQDAAIQFEDPTGTADPHGIFHYATEALKKVPRQKGVPYIYPQGMSDHNRVLQHEAYHSILDDYLNASMHGPYKGLKGTAYENSPLTKFHQDALDYKLGDDDINELITRLVDVEELGDGGTGGLIRLAIMNSDVRHAYADWKSGNLSEYEMKLKLANFITAFDIKDIVKETSGMKHMSAEHTARIKELSIKKFKESIGADPDVGGDMVLYDVDVSHLVKAAEKKIKDFNMAEKINAMSDEDFAQDDWGNLWTRGGSEETFAERVKEGKESFIASYNGAIDESPSWQPEVKIKPDPPIGFNPMTGSEYFGSGFPSRFP